MAQCHVEERKASKQDITPESETEKQMQRGKYKEK